MNTRQKGVEMTPVVAILVAVALTIVVAAGLDLARISRAIQPEARR